MWLAYWRNFHAVRPLNLEAWWWIQSRFFLFFSFKAEFTDYQPEFPYDHNDICLKDNMLDKLRMCSHCKKNPVLGRFVRESARLPSFLFLQTVLLLADGNDLAEWKESLFPMMPYFQTAWMWKKPSVMIYALSSISPYAAQSKFKNSMSKSWGGKSAANNHGNVTCGVMCTARVGRQSAKAFYLGAKWCHLADIIALANQDSKR